MIELKLWTAGNFGLKIDSFILEGSEITILAEGHNKLLEIMTFAEVVCDSDVYGVKQDFLNGLIYDLSKKASGRTAYGTWHCEWRKVEYDLVAL